MTTPPARTISIRDIISSSDCLAPDALPYSIGALPGSMQAMVVDVMALTGDSSDNIPGVPGIGRKTAAKLINRWRSLDALYLSVLTGYTDRALTPRLAGLLKTHIRDAFLSRELVRLDRPPPPLEVRP